ncbi:MAG: chorismate-binding protein [Candidatus Omnitrophica bacterium]|nr:chorismate-binding protein [Candidatus Omnitrophota bacterium]
MDIIFQFSPKRICFRDPLRLIVCHRTGDVHRALEEVDRARLEGYFVAGFVSYELGYAFEPCFSSFDSPVFPLLCFGVYRTPAALDRLYRPGNYAIRDLSLNITKDDYARDIRTIKKCIAQGEVYQITYCIKFKFNLLGDAFACYEALLCDQPVPYPVYLETEDFCVMSLSPELFLKKERGYISSKPMKGTWPRGEGLWGDLWERLRFQYDQKNRAENVMIADVLRNDLGRVATCIRTPRLFEVAGYRTLFQMTSTVTGKLSVDENFSRILKAVFPSGSVTGAPRIRAMEIIRSLEREPRHIYTGAIGYITPEGDWFFNIPIRTILVRKGHLAEMGVGGGIVWDSTEEGEWAEGLLKARFLTDKKS